MTPRRAPVVLAVAFAVSIATAGFSWAVELTYEEPTSAPEGLAVCSFRGFIKNASVGGSVEADVAPTAGEGLLSLSVRGGGSGVASAGIQLGCDIFPDAPGQTLLTFPASPRKLKVLGVLNMHAHPGNDCASASVAKGTITLNVTPPATFKAPKLRCDDVQEHANLRLAAALAPTGTTGEPLDLPVLIQNHGPADATGVTLDVKLPKSFFPTKATPSQGTCVRDFQKHRVRCELGTLGFFGNPTAEVDLGVIPLRQGVVKTKEIIAGTNDGKVFERNDTIETDVAKGSSSILNLTLKCKGAGGTVTINPNGSGGVTTCTCPDPNDATKEEVTCIEIYAQKTTVTLTPNATKGAFDKWKGACAANPAACTLTLDPSAQNPDALTTAKFK